MLTEREFQRLVRDALDALPRQFRYALENVAIVIEEEPGGELLKDMDLDPEEDELFGLYQGVPLTERDHQYTGLPDRILIFRGPLLRCFETREELIDEVKKTVIHELGHHMGLDDEEMAY